MMRSFKCQEHHLLRKLRNKVRLMSKICSRTLDFFELHHMDLGAHNQYKKASKSSNGEFLCISKAISDSNVKAKCITLIREILKFTSKTHQPNIVHFKKIVEINSAALS